jgi:hypothetical protein
VHVSESDEEGCRLQKAFATVPLTYGAILITRCVSSELARLHDDAAYSVKFKS